LIATGKRINIEGGSKGGYVHGTMPCKLKFKMNEK